MKRLILQFGFLFFAISCLAQVSEQPYTGKKINYDGYIQVEDLETSKIIQKKTFTVSIEIKDVKKINDALLVTYSSSPDEYLENEMQNRLTKNESASFLYYNNIAYKLFYRCTYDSMKIWLANKQFLNKSINDIYNYSDGRIFLEPFYDFSSTKKDTVYEFSRFHHFKSVSTNKNGDKYKVFYNVSRNRKESSKIQLTSLYFFRSRTINIDAVGKYTTIYFKRTD